MPGPRALVATALLHAAMLLGPVVAFWGLLMPIVDIFAWIHVETRDRLLWYDHQLEVKLCALTWLLVLRVLGDYIPIVIALPLLRGLFANSQEASTRGIAAKDTGLCGNRLRRKLKHAAGNECTCAPTLLHGGRNSRNADQDRQLASPSSISIEDF